MTNYELRRLRKRKGVSAYTVARVIGVSAPTVYRWEGGHRKIHPAFARLLTLYFEGRLGGQSSRSKQRFMLGR
jgi:DNA-binding transcriptional regulator YiaG